MKPTTCSSCGAAVFYANQKGDGEPITLNRVRELIYYLTGNRTAHAIQDTEGEAVRPLLGHTVHRCKGLKK